MALARTCVPEKNLSSTSQRITAGADDDVLVEVGMGVGPVGFDVEQVELIWAMWRRGDPGDGANLVPGVVTRSQRLEKHDRTRMRVPSWTDDGPSRASGVAAGIRIGCAVEQRCPAADSVTVATGARRVGEQAWPW